MIRAKVWSILSVETYPRFIASSNYLLDVSRAVSLRSEGLEGSVIVKFDIDTNGRVINSFILRSSGHNELDLIALEAIQQLRYNPKLVG